VSWAISSGMAMKRSARKTIYLILSLLPLCTFSQAAEDATSKLDRVLSRDIRLKAEPLHPPPAPRDVASTLFLIFFSVVHPECPHGPCPQVETPEQMIARFRAGAEAGKSLFQWLLAAYLMTGESVPRDFDQGLYWLEKAAASGDGPAVQDLTRLYEAGVAMPNSPDNIVGYYEASSRPDLLPQVLTNFGHLYEFGDRLPRDFERAKMWYERASAEHDRQEAPSTDYAAERLGILYASGQLGPRAYGIAAKWFLKAAENGEGEGGGAITAQCALAVMYAGGLGVSANLERARFWGNKLNTPDECKPDR